VAIVNGAPGQTEAFCLCTVGPYKVRVAEKLKCSTLDSCSYNNGGCEQNCTTLSGGGRYQCSCSAGYYLQANNRSCTAVGSNVNVAVNGSSINCNVLNGGCDWYCVRGVNGAADYCACPVGYNMSVDSTDCIDVNECALSSACPQQRVCLNTLGSFYCVSLGFGSVLPGESPAPVAQSSALSDVSLQANSLQANVNSASVSTSHLSASFYALVAWLIVVSVALIIIAVVSYRRWRARLPAVADPYESSFAGSLRAAGPDTGSVFGEKWHVNNERDGAGQAGGHLEVIAQTHKPSCRTFSDCDATASNIGHSGGGTNMNATNTLNDDMH